MIGNRMRLFSRRRRQPPDEHALAAAMAGRADNAPDDGAPAPAGEAETSLGYELLLYGNEQILRGSDNGTLVAFVAIAFQQIRGRGEFHNDVGCGILLLSVLLCAIVHFAIGYAYVGRAGRMLNRAHRGGRDVWVRRGFVHLAWFATLLQFVCVILGSILILIQTAPPWLDEWLNQIF